MLVDARGMRCPWPALRLARAMREQAGGVTIVADDPIAPAELAALARERGWRIEAVETEIGAGWTVTG
jgi:tRNA 2-thiouridine synthesizing protein A